MMYHKNHHHHATVSSRSSSSGHSSMPSLRMRTSPPPPPSLFHHAAASTDITSFDASHFIFNEKRRDRRERKCAILRRYNSHDSGAAAVDTSTAGGGINAPAPDGGEFPARDFLERYSLPRVVRVDGGEPLLLYRCFDNFTKIEARPMSGKRTIKDRQDSNRILHFPEGYNGWFSLINEKGEKSATTHTSVLQLVREQVCSFISIQPFTAYAGHNADPLDVLTSNSMTKLQYLKTQVKGGQLFQLRAVFQHRDHDNGRMSTKSKLSTKSARDKDLANRYAQLISQNNQEFYVPLTTKGEFYEIHSSVKAKLCFPGMLDKTGPLALDKDCLYKLTHILRRVALPIRVKLMVGPLPKDFPDTFILERKFQEPLLVTCTLPPPMANGRESSTHQISCVNLNAHVTIARCWLGFDSENRLFKSQRLQAALAFCHTNVDTWYREVRLAPNEHRPPVLQVKATTMEESKQLITPEILEKFPKSKKWYKNFRGFMSGEENEEEIAKIRSTERYKDMSKLIEEKFGRKTHNPVKKSASFMFATKRIDLSCSDEDSGGGKGKANQGGLLKCQSLDTQLFGNSSAMSDSLSVDFQLCILDDENEEVATTKKNKPDLIPTLPKAEIVTRKNVITERLCNEFHVKTKIQKRTVSKALSRTTVVGNKEEEVDIPYSKVADEIGGIGGMGQKVKSHVQKTDENVYAEICEAHACTSCGKQTFCTCNNNMHTNTKVHSEYCYVKLGSNGESVTSSSEEAIYNTLR